MDITALSLFFSQSSLPHLLGQPEFLVPHSKRTERKVSSFLWSRESLSYDYVGNAFAKRSSKPPRGKNLRLEWSSACNKSHVSLLFVRFPSGDFYPAGG